MSTSTIIDKVTVKAGDVFSCMWGYDQTNVDYYQVISVSKSGKSVKVQQIQKIKKYTDYLCGESTAVKNNFIGDVMTRKLKTSPNTSKPYFRVNSYSHAFYMTDPTTSSFFSEWH